MDVRYIKALVRNSLLIAAVTALTVIISGIVSYTIAEPEYKAAVQLLISEQTEDGKIDLNTVVSNGQLTITFRDVLNSPLILNRTITELGLPDNAASLRERLTVENVPNSQVLEIAVTDSKKETAAATADTLAATFQQEIKPFMQTTDIHILNSAAAPDSVMRISPSPLKNMAVASGIGLLLGVCFVIVEERTNRTIKSEAEAEESLGLPVLGVVSPLPSESFPDWALRAKRGVTKQQLVN